MHKQELLFEQYKVDHVLSQYWLFAQLASIITRYSVASMF
jgi:hypothetical protein